LRLGGLDFGIRSVSKILFGGGSGRWLGLFIAVWSSAVAAADLTEAQKQFLSGNYTQVVAAAEKALEERPRDEEAHLLFSRSLLALGRYPEAQAAITKALTQDRGSIRLLWQARLVFLSNGQTATANQIVRAISTTFENDPRSFADAQSLVAYGQAKLLQGADPKQVLDQLYEPAKKIQVGERQVYLAGGNLALEKHDFALAAKRFAEGLKQLPNDPDLHLGMAQAYAPSDDALMLTSLETALDRNSNHVGSLLLLADHLIDAEDYPEAEKYLARAVAVNPWEPEAWAYRAVLAHFQNQEQTQQSARETALKFWPNNPRVDYLIGRKLSQKYRFTEGAERQRQALQFDPGYLPAKAQLAQDLLRLGEEAEGWSMALEVQKKDGYDAEAFNLANLHDTMSKFTALTNDDFVLRMSTREAGIYGARALELLSKARTNLCAKYGIQVQRPTIVEIFPEQKDFAVRTFGMPGNPGYLGVCFGKVITANSPAAHMGHPINWEAVLWHEFCHVVTLQLTRNKMPRWLSEGISVYEELQANPAWGQRMTPEYREMVLGGELTPVSELSAAFLTPPTEMHLQFAYYESELVVEFLIQRFGLEQFKDLLHDLGEGAEINQAIEKHSAPMDQIEKDFAAFARDRAEKLAPGLGWEKPEFEKFASKPARRGQARSPRDKRSQSSTNSVPESPLVVTTSNAPMVMTNITKTTNSVPVHPSINQLSQKSKGDLWETWAKDRPTNFWVMSRRAQQFAEEKQWAEAKPILEHMVRLYPDFTGPESAYRLLAAAHRNLGETNVERQVLAKFAELDDSAPDAYSRLMELGAAAQDWPAVFQNAQRYLAVNPLVASPYRSLAEAGIHTGQTQTAIGAYRALLALDPPDPAEVRLRLGQLLHRSGDPAARRQVLQALEEAPRYREALQLLLEITGESPSAKAAGTPSAESKP
jgi:tetratricopeptide (TPR) repeat protein